MQTNPNTMAALIATNVSVRSIIPMRLMIMFHQCIIAPPLPTNVWLKTLRYDFPPMAGFGTVSPGPTF
jgi:hypothetical protein